MGRAYHSAAIGRRAARQRAASGQRRAAELTRRPCRYLPRPPRPDSLPLALQQQGTALLASRQGAYMHDCRRKRLCAAAQRCRPSFDHLTYVGVQTVLLAPASMMHARSFIFAYVCTKAKQCGWRAGAGCGRPGKPRSQRRRDATPAGC